MLSILTGQNIFFDLMFSYHKEIFILLFSFSYSQLIKNGSLDVFKDRSFLLSKKSILNALKGEFIE